MESLSGFFVGKAQAAGLLGNLGASDAPMASIGAGSEIIINVLNIMFSLAGIAGISMILWGAFKLFTSGGSPEKAKEAKKVIVAALIGTAIVVLAASAVAFYVSVLGGSTGSIL